MMDFLYEESSGCCGARIIEPDICGECGEHCPIIRHMPEPTFVDYAMALREMRNEVSRVYHNLQDSMDFKDAGERKKWTQDAIDGLKTQYNKTTKLIQYKL